MFRVWYDYFIADIDAEAFGICFEINVHGNFYLDEDGEVVWHGVDVVAFDTIKFIKYGEWYDALLNNVGQHLQDTIYEKYMKLDHENY